MTAPALDVDVRTTVGEFQLTAEFRVDHGTAVLFGPSGSGKSLTVALVAGLLRPDEGTIAIRGRLVAAPEQRLHVSTQDRRVGLVFQDGLLLPHRTVLDNVRMAVRTGDRSRRREVGLSWLDRVGAADLADRRPGSLSGGQRQRIALARALAGSPDLLLLDEPLSALDLAVRRELRDVIGEVVAAAGIPTVLVTHDQDEAEALGDVVVDVEFGRATGTRPLTRHHLADPSGGALR